MPPPLLLLLSAAGFTGRSAGLISPIHCRRALIVRAPSQEHRTATTPRPSFRCHSRPWSRCWQCQGRQRRRLARRPRAPPSSWAAAAPTRTAAEALPSSGAPQRSHAAGAASRLTLPPLYLMLSIFAEIVSPFLAVLLPSRRRPFMPRAETADLLRVPFRDACSACSGVPLLYCSRVFAGAFSSAATSRDQKEFIVSWRYEGLLCGASTGLLRPSPDPFTLPRLGPLKLALVCLFAITAVLM